MKRYLLAMTMALCLTGSDGPVAADEAPRVTGLFSDMRRIAEAGDVVGMEVFIVYSTDGIRGRHWAFVQIAEGVPAQPFLVEVSVVGDQRHVPIRPTRQRRRKSLNKTQPACIQVRETV